MHLMQYEIPIPDGYDIRERVRLRGSSTDAYPDLGLKAYCVTDTHYSPFYFWRAPDGMNRFLYRDGGFHNIVNDFGRPPVKHWMGVAFHRGGATEVRTATRRVVPFPPHIEIPDFAEHQAFFAHATGIDPDSWQLVEFTLWPGEPPANARYDIAYDVLHVSAPELTLLSQDGL
jgi:hypothetical protein